MLPDAFGCVVANRFGNLLDDDADPFDFINEVETEKEKKKKKKKEEEDKKGKQKKSGQKESQRDRRVPVMDGPDLGPAHKQLAHAGPAPEGVDGKAESRRGLKMAAFRERRPNQGERPQEFSVSVSSYNPDPDNRGRGGFRGRRGARGGGGYVRNPDNFALRGKREYDRHNGTGISPEEKRGGRGPWNWGCVEENASEIMEVTSDAAVKSEEPQVPVDEENPATAEEGGEMVVQVAMEMTLDEWKALQEVGRPKAEFNLRKAEDKIPSKAKVIHKSKHVENLKESLEDMEDEGNFLRRSVNDITSLLDINFGSLGRPSRGGRGRGARGGLASLPERPRPRPEKGDDVAPDPDDPEDFPALSAGR
ncbi:intracellular hyaluronan-binding protein 4.L-like [Aulostomus maculatus]